MKKLIISAPFGNYLTFANATSTLGTYTLHKRAGLLKRIWRCLATIRYNHRSKSWLNKLGLPNPGIASLKTAKDCILNIHGFNKKEWLELIRIAIELRPEAVEFNLSCPNIDHKASIEEVRDAIDLGLTHGVRLIAKLPPVRWMAFGEPLYKIGVRRYHLCNTIPTPGGGQSGKPLMQYSLWAIDDFRQRFGNEVILIGGGGVSTREDVQKYLDTGADHVAIASILINPLNWLKVKSLI